MVCFIWPWKCLYLIPVAVWLGMSPSSLPQMGTWSEVCHRKACDGWTEFDLIAFLVCKLLDLGSVVLWSGFRNVFQVELTGSCGALKQRVTFSAWSGSQPHIYTSLLLSWLLCLGVFLIVAYLKCILLMAVSERALYGVIGENSFLVIYVKMNRLFGV